MDKWLAKFLDDTLEKRTDKADMLPELVSMSGMSGADSVDLAKIEAATVTPTIATGSMISWRRGDGTQPEGFVDAIHVDDTGTRWAFVSLAGGTWAAVNVKFLKGVNR